MQTPVTQLYARLYIQIQISCTGVFHVWWNATWSIPKLLAKSSPKCGRLLAPLRGEYRGVFGRWTFMKFKYLLNLIMMRLSAPLLVLLLAGVAPSHCRPTDDGLQDVKGQNPGNLIN